ncbi:hypothetical protein GCM10007301_21420 [Azorhizobium oxalatiphilum]|uniref:DUF3568 family protein n=1 Tax=Azorhizobium oxalatiphilum TaxID=980631 RepID=A0A917BY45_9HYPH|nr:hypothetical protein [Azorhizobium oxalatiphilum]GGF61369.1 hypothetical protein GCM10007301_21420 [Azorhizobium oxalatiphilum]
MRPVLIAAVLILSGASAHAASCEANFSVGGVPGLSAMSFRTWQEFPKVTPEAALKRLAQAVAAEGFDGIRTNKELNAIDAVQETTGSGRAQTLRVTARKTKTGTRVDAIFNIQAGQLTSEGVVREGLCKIIAETTP